MQHSVDVVGNYFRITSNGVNNISSVHLYYACTDSRGPNANITLKQASDFAFIEEDASGNVNFGVKGTYSGELKQEDLTLRTSDKYNEYSTTCHDLQIGENNEFVAKFSLSGIIWNTNYWAQYTYCPRLYVNGYRINTPEGNIYVDGVNVEETRITHATNENDAQMYRIYQKPWGAVVSYCTNQQHRGLRFENMGTTGTASYAPSMWEEGGTWVSLYITGWVSNEEEAAYAMNVKESYTLKSTTGTSESQHTFYVKPEKCSAEAADGGYKINLCFDITSLRDDIRPMVVGLYYEDVPYFYRDGGNSGLLTMTATKGTPHDTKVAETGHDWVWYQMYKFYDWLTLKGVNAQND